jgi:nicotinate-nucleotide adenylyltransferase
VPGIGVFGGTFNPIHLGHLRAAEEFREACGLDEVRLIPSALPPHKTPDDLASAADRLRMVELAVEGTPGFRPWAVELDRPGPSYSVDTLRALRAGVPPATRIVFAIGRDAFADFHTWKEHEAIFGLCDVAVLTRPPWPERLVQSDFPVVSQKAFCYDSTGDAFRHVSGHSVTFERITALDISATDIRDRVRTRRSIRFLVPPAVESYIATHGLYRSEDVPR